MLVVIIIHRITSQHSVQHPRAFTLDSFSTLACCILSGTLLIPISCGSSTMTFLASSVFVCVESTSRNIFPTSFSSLFIFPEYSEQNRSAFAPEYRNLLRIIQQGRMTEPTLGSSQKAVRLGLENKQEEEKLTAGYRTKLW